jgi:hypothetical protein
MYHVWHTHLASACGGDPPVILSPGGAEMACRMVFVAWLAFGVISIGIGNGSSGIGGMIIGRRGRVVWRGRVWCALSVSDLSPTSSSCTQ